MKNKKKILITSIGSLVGQNILDSLQNRRDNLQIVGTNSLAEVANNFRCDRAYVVSIAEEIDHYIEQLTDIIEKEQPDLIIPGRDDDVVILAQLSKKMTKFQDHFLVGSEDFARVMDNKVKSYQFALQHNLPFAPTISSGTSEAKSNARQLVDKYGYPLIAKPSKGNGSRGIWIVLKESQLNKIIKESGFAIQPLFGQVNDFDLDTSIGLPFFWEIPETRLFAAQVIINRNHEINSIFGFISMMVGGKCVRMDKCSNPKLIKVVRRFADAAIKEGWRGSFNIQLKEDLKHGLQVIEMNGRFSGGTSARYYLGFDEVGWTLEDWIEEGVIPEKPLPKGMNVVTKILTDFPIKKSDVYKLNKEQVWTSKK